MRVRVDPLGLESKVIMAPSSWVGDSCGSESVHSADAYRVPGTASTAQVSWGQHRRPAPGASPCLLP